MRAPWMTPEGTMTADPSRSYCACRVYARRLLDTGIRWAQEVKTQGTSRQCPEER